jgi:cytochrome c oxidase assembly protein subunit 15
MQGEDLATLLLQGLLIGAIPLALVWALRGDRRLAKLASVTAFLTFDLVVFGAFTRLTGSGLGCPDWPGCFAKANPLAAQSDIAQAAALAPGGPVDMTKAWIEMIHRSLAMGVGVLIVVLLVMSWQQREQGARLGLALLALVMVLVQGAFGAFTVTMKLFPAIVTAHLLLALTLLAILTWQAAALNPGLLRSKRAMGAKSGAATRPISRQAGVPGYARALAAAALVVVALQIALGGWVSTNYAVLACADFPLCHGVLVPPMDFAHGFTLWHQLGRQADDGALSIDALTAIHWTHRNMAMVVALVLMSLAATLWRSELKPEARILVVLLVAQICSGIANVIFGWPLVAAVLHNAGAGALVATLVLVNYRLRLLPVSSRGIAPRIQSAHP